MRCTAFKTAGTKSDLSRRINSVDMAPGSNLLEELGRIVDLATEMHTTGFVLGDHMLYTIFVDALPTEYDVVARNPESRDSIGHEDIIEPVRMRYDRHSENRKKGTTASGHATYAGDADGGGRGRGGGGREGKSL